MRFGEVIDHLCANCKFHTKCSTEESMSRHPQEEVDFKSCDMYRKARTQL